MNHPARFELISKNEKIHKNVAILFSNVGDALPTIEIGEPFDNRPKISLDEHLRLHEALQICRRCHRLNRKKRCRIVAVVEPDRNVQSAFYRE